MLTHPIQRRFAAEDLVRRRRSDEHARTASSQRQGRIDPNPHQVDAVMFALGRLTEGGCIRSEEHTSELQSLTNLVCRLLLEKKKTRSRNELATNNKQTKDKIATRKCTAK